VRFALPMRPVSLLLAACMCAATGRPTLAGDAAPVLAGSLFKIASDETRSTPVSGAAVYVHPAASRNADDWIGPNLTDVYGRYSFSNIPSGQYLMRIYSGSIHLWEQVVAVPSKLAPIVVRDVRVVYYPKAADGTTIDAILAKLPLPTDRATSRSTLATNTLWFGDRVNLSDVKLVAGALVSGGVQLRAIRRFNVGGDWHAKVIEIGASPQHVSDTTLTVREIDAARDFPRANP
jgi:hypothetical protein